MAISSDLPLSHIQIPGPLLAAILRTLTVAPSDVSGLLFGAITPLPTSLSDDPTPTAVSLSVASLHSHLSFPSPFLPASPPSLGTLSARRNAPLRPSVRDYDALMSRKARVFLLFSEVQVDGVWTYEFGAWEVREGRMERVSVKVENVGVGLSGAYGVLKGEVERGRVERLVGRKAEGYKEEVEGLYGDLLGRLRTLARLVEETDKKVAEKENKNRKLRNKIAGLE